LVYIVRHGVTDWNQAGCIQGQLDVPLNAAGRAQAVLAAQAFMACGATALYSSDLLRAYETAQIIGRQTGLQVIQKPGLREMDFGAWQGLTSAQILARDPEVYAARRERPYDVPPPGGETWQRFYQRVLQALRDILQATDAQRIIVSTHSGVCTVLGLEALGLGYAGKRLFGNANCAIHTLAIHATGWQAVSLNDTSHLDPMTPPNPALSS
jgi:broad specificity phosphatase PhoE